MNDMRATLSALCLLAAVALLPAGCGRRAAADEHFGEPFSAAPLVTVAQLLETPEAFRRQAVRVQGAIVRQCPATGCWFFITDGRGQSIKIELGDYLPKLPQRVGSMAEVEGEWIKKGDGHEFIGTRVTFSKQAAP